MTDCTLTPWKMLSNTTSQNTHNINFNVFLKLFDRISHILSVDRHKEPQSEAVIPTEA